MAIGFSTRFTVDSMLVPLYEINLRLWSATTRFELATPLTSIKRKQLGRTYRLATTSLQPFNQGPDLSTISEPVVFREFYRIQYILILIT